MDDIYCYAFVEDAPSKEVVVKLLEHRNESSSSSRRLCFVQGFPSVMHGSGNLRKKCPSILEMAKGGTPVICLVDLDATSCAGVLLADWFSIQKGRKPAFPDGLVFRVAVREVEAWIMADVRAWSSYIGIPAANFSNAPDELSDPKQYLLNVIRKKGKKKIHAEMLPQGTAHVGPCYNEVLCKFVQTKWSPSRAAEHSPSLGRAIQSLQRLQ
ncbi:MAG: DUF4276 family protein [Candidatus Hydrogenedentes bacterium]|nr:DUF4276 family protein [Candidatus Hydrogenedentota bacterium]